MRTFLFAVLLVLGGCASVPERPTASLDIERYAAVGCASAATALKVLTIAVREDRLTDDQKEMALEAARKIAVICESPTAPTYDTLVQVGFDAAVLYLAKLAVEQNVSGDRL